MVVVVQSRYGVFKRLPPLRFQARDLASQSHQMQNRNLGPKYCTKCQTSLPPSRLSLRVLSFCCELNGATNPFALGAEVAWGSNSAESLLPLGIHVRLFSFRAHAASLCIFFVFPRRSAGARILSRQPNMIVKLLALTIFVKDDLP